MNKPCVLNGNIKRVYTIGTVVTRTHAVQRSLALFEARRAINVKSLEENKETDWRYRFVAKWWLIKILEGLLQNRVIALQFFVKTGFSQNPYIYKRFYQ